MKNLDLSYIGNVIANLSGIPVRVYENSKLIVYRSLVQLVKDPIVIYQKEIFAIKDHIGYFITPDFYYYGIINSDPYKIVIGPSRQSSIQDQGLKEIAFRADVEQDDIYDFVSSMKSIIQMPLLSLVEMLCTLNYVLNEEKLTVADITIYDAQQKEMKEKLEIERAKNEMNLKAIMAMPETSSHNTISIEKRLLNIVLNGNVAALNDFIKNAPAIKGGTLSLDSIRQFKNTFIVTATLVSRAAIRGGMDGRDALSLSDSYIRKCEFLFDEEKIINLQYRMIIDYTERVEKLRNGKSPSKFICDINNYIQHHLSEPINVDKMAKAMYFNRSYFSSKFKKETGMIISNYIMKEKIEEAKRLLRYSDKPATAIAAYLGFSSQSHFFNAFHKYTNNSPSEYRQKHNK